MPKPMTVGILGTGEVAAKAAIALLEDLTETNDPVHFVFAADQRNWTDVAQEIAEFIAENDVPFDLVVDDEAEVDEDFLKAAQTVVKVARPGIGVVRQLERAEGEKRLVVLLDESDEDGLKAIERAIDKGIAALDLTAGLEPLVFGDDDGVPSDPSDKQEAPAEEAEPPKRKRRTKAEMEAARAAERGDTAEESMQADADADDEDRPAVLDDIPVDLDTAYAAQATVDPSAAGWQDRAAAEFALAQAIIFHAGREGDYPDVVKTAHAFKGFLTGNPVQTTPGRPRADGSPAEPRERDEEGKPVRRRRSS